MFWIDIQDSVGTKLGDGPIRSGIRWTYRQRLNRAGDWSLEVPIGETKLTYTTLKRHLHCYTIRNGQVAWMGGGPLEDAQVSMRGRSVPAIVLSGADVLRTLAATTVSFAVDYTAIPGSGATVLNTIITQAGGGWTLSTSGTIPEMTGRFVHESALNAFVTACDKMGLMFRIDGFPLPGYTVVVRDTPQTTSLIATNLGDTIGIENNSNACLITDIQQERSAWELVNQIIVYGAGEGEARLTLFAADEWPDGSSVTGSYAVSDLAGVSHIFALNKAANTITDTASVISYGTYRQAVAFKDVAPVSASDADMTAAANALVLSAVNRLLTSSQPQEQYQVSVAGLSHELLPGQKIRVAARKFMDGSPLINIDKDLLVLETETQIDVHGARIVGLTVSTSREFVKTDAEVLLNQIQQARAFEAHPQTKNNENTLTYREDVDDDYDATFPFWFSRGTVTIQSVTLRFKLEKLRSTVKSISSASTTTSSGGGQTPTSSTEPTSTPTTFSDNAFHGHQFTLVNSAVGTAVQYSGGISSLTTTGGGTVGVDAVNATHDHDIEIPGHDHTVTVEPHDHTVTPNVQMLYGVFEDPDPAYVVGDLDWLVNAVPVAETPTSITGGWYELDLTDYIINPANLRPLTSANTVTVTVSSPTGKKVRVTAQIELRTTIQSLAVV